MGGGGSAQPGSGCSLLVGINLLGSLGPTTGLWQVSGCSGRLVPALAG